MCRIICVVMAVILYGAVAAHGQTPQPGRSTVISFTSATYSDFGQLLSARATVEVVVRAQLVFPDQAQDRHPAVIVVHTLGGYRDANEGYVAGELRKAGFATLTYDSFAARGTSGAALSASPGYLPIGVADAYAALRALSRQPGIDAARIAVIGFSYGGDVAHLTAFDRLRTALNSDPSHFAAHVAFYPGGNFGAVAEPHAYTGAAVLLLLGAQDDNLPISKVNDYLAYLQAAGATAPIETIIYPGAHHAWTVPDLPAARFYPGYVSTKRCPHLLLGAGKPALLVEGTARPFDPAVFAACLAAAPGYTMGFNAVVRAQSIADAIAFLQRTMR